MKAKFLLVVFVVFGGAFVLSLSGSLPEAGAAFPGQNGKIAFHSERGGNFDVYVVNADGSGRTRLTDDPANDFGPAFSPDGAKIAFESERGGNRDVYVMNADGSDQVRLTNGEGGEGSPTWSPDGAKIAFESERGGNRDVYTMNADGSGQTRLTEDPSEDLSPAWSPDGAKIAYTSGGVYGSSGRRIVGELYVMSAEDGSGRTQLTFADELGENFGGSDPAWSPDGAKIVFSRSQQCHRYEVDLFTINADGSELRPLTQCLDAYAPAFSPDGTKITHSTDLSWDYPDYAVFVMNQDGSGRTRLTSADQPSTGEISGGPDWQPLAPRAQPIPSPKISAPANDSQDTDGVVAFSGTAEANTSVRIFEVSKSGARTYKTSAEVSPTGDWGVELDGVSDGEHSYVATANDEAGYASPASDPVKVSMDSPNRAGFEKASVKVAEGQQAAISVVREGPTGGTLTVQYWTAYQDSPSDPGRAEVYKDYAYSEEYLTFGPGETRKTFPVPTVDDDLDEGDETVVLELGHGEDAGPLVTSELTITDDDGPPPDTQAPGAPAITSPANNSYDKDGNLTISGTAEKGAKIRLFEGTVQRGTIATTSATTGAWRISLAGVVDGRHFYTAKAEDAADNVSAASSRRTVTVDRRKPSGSVRVNNGAKATGSRTVRLAIRAADPAPASGVAQMRFSNDGRKWSAWQPYATSKRWTLTTGAGTKTVRAQYRDRAGNTSSIASDTIRYTP